MSVRKIIPIYEKWPGSGGKFDTEQHPSKRRSHYACLGIGSNIQPERNLKLSIHRLREIAVVKKVSSVYETESYGAAGPNFLNAAVLIITNHPVSLLKSFLYRIEVLEGRIRTEDKNAPRIIDLDILLFDDRVIDPDIWSRAFAAVPLSEIYPDFIDPISNKSLKEVSSILSKNSWIIRREDISLTSN